MLDEDKNHEKHLAAFEAQGHAAGLNAEPASLSVEQDSGDIQQRTSMDEISDADTYP